MAQLIYINGYLLPDSDIIEYPSGDEAISYEDFQAIPDRQKIILDNTDKSKYDDRYAGSFFYNGQNVNTICYIFDTDKNKITYRGIVRDVQTNESDNKITVECGSYMTSLGDINCTYSNSTSKVPALIIYEILTQVAGISTDDIDYAGFANAISIQTANGLYYKISYNEENTVDCLTVINELQRISDCLIYPVLNIIKMVQLKEYSGEQGNIIYDIIPKSYTQKYSIEAPFKLYNSYRVYYNSSDVLTYVEGSDSESIAEWGEMKFIVPDSDVTEDDDVTTINILAQSAAAATYCGTHKIALRKYIMELCDLKCDDSYDYIHVGEIVNLRFKPFFGEPVLIVERKSDAKNKLLAFKCLFLNRPHQRVAMDKTPPDPVEIVSAVPIDGGVMLKWTRDESSDHLGYKIYFSTSPGFWNQEQCQLGMSPVEMKRTDLSLDGYVYQEIVQLSPGVRYFFKVTAIDTSLNESDFSNIKSCTVSLNYSNQYFCSGNSGMGICLDVNNSYRGSVPLGLATFPYTFDFEFADYAAAHESGIIFKSDYFSFLSFFMSGNTEMQYKISNDNVTWTAWTSGGFTSGSIDLNCRYLQYRFLFRSMHWNDADMCFIRNLE